jgi:hypothetical protein
MALLSNAHVKMIFLEEPMKTKLMLLALILVLAAGVAFATGRQSGGSAGGAPVLSSPPRV